MNPVYSNLTEQTSNASNLIKEQQEVGQIRNTIQGHSYSLGAPQQLEGQKYINNLEYNPPDSTIPKVYSAQVNIISVKQSTDLTESSYTHNIDPNQMDNTSTDANQILIDNNDEIDDLLEEEETDLLAMLAKNQEIRIAAEEDESVAEKNENLSEKNEHVAEKVQSAVDETKIFVEQEERINDEEILSGIEIRQAGSEIRQEGVQEKTETTHRGTQINKTISNVGDIISKIEQESRAKFEFKKEAKEEIREMRRQLQDICKRENMHCEQGEDLDNAIGEYLKQEIRDPHRDQANSDFSERLFTHLSDKGLISKFTADGQKRPLTKDEIKALSIEFKPILTKFLADQNALLWEEIKNKAQEQLNNNKHINQTKSLNLNKLYKELKDNNISSNEKDLILQSIIKSKLYNTASGFKEIYQKLIEHIKEDRKNQAEIKEEYKKHKIIEHEKDKWNEHIEEIKVDKRNLDWLISELHLDKVKIPVHTIDPRTNQRNYTDMNYFFYLHRDNQATIR